MREARDRAGLRIDRRSFIQAGAVGALGLGWGVPRLSGRPPAAAAELSNGIRLPEAWPPRRDVLTPDPPAPPPYLSAPPPILPIDAGRQLFVDDFLIESSTLRRAYHAAESHPGNPVLRPDKPWEQEGSPTAMVFSDGVFYDPKERLYKMWYMGGHTRATCHAVSRDGIAWEKPAFDIRPGTNIVHPGRRDSGTVWLDLEEPDPARRHKMFLYDFAGGLSIQMSPDGVHWKETARSGPTGDRTTVFWNAQRRVWVYSLRGDYNVRGIGRCRRYWETERADAGIAWKAEEPPLWIGADDLDPRRDDLKTQCQLYNLDAIAYESIILGLFTIWRGQPADRPKPNEVCAGFSRDGYHWHRPDRRPLIAVSERHGDWNWGNVQSAGGCCLIAGDKLYFYFSGRAGVRGTPGPGVCCTGLATLRRDGFASMDAGPEEGTLTTRPVRFSGKRLFVNADAASGELRAEILDEGGKVLEPFSRSACSAVRADKTLQEVRWEGAADVSAAAGRPVRVRFHVKNARLYAFWFSPDGSGASRGFLAAGGPGFSGTTDTRGSGA